MFPGGFAEAVLDPHSVDAGDVEHGKVDRCGWERTGIADTMAKLVRRA